MKSSQDKQPIVKLPEKVKVACFDITIEAWTHHKASENARFGEFSALTLTIRIDNSLSDIKKVDTLLHEINHAIYWAYSMDDNDKEERIVGTFATAWTQVYRDNPELLKFIGDSL